MRTITITSTAVAEIVDRLPLAIATTLITAVVGAIGMLAYWEVSTVESDKASEVYLAAEADYQAKLEKHNSAEMRLVRELVRLNKEMKAKYK